jgi:hypothetical protein
MTQRKDVVTWADIMAIPLDEIPKGDIFARGNAPVDPLRAQSMASALATYSEGETLLRAQAAEAQQLAKQMMDERDKLRAECAALRREIAALMDDH